LLKSEEGKKKSRSGGKGGGGRILLLRQGKRKRPDRCAEEKIVCHLKVAERAESLLLEGRGGYAETRIPLYISDEKNEVHPVTGRRGKRTNFRRRAAVPREGNPIHQKKKGADIVERE